MTQEAGNDLLRKKLSQVRELMSAQGMDAVRIGLQKNVSWLTGGRSHVNTASEPACCLLIVTIDHLYMVVNNIEADRLIEEEIASDGHLAMMERHIWPWDAPQERERLASALTEGLGRVGTDAELEPWFLSLRAQVLSEELPMWRELGKLTCEAIEETAWELQQGDTEMKIAGQLALACWKRGLEPIVSLIAVDERTKTRRHPLPTELALQQYAMLVICTRKNGRIASATRLVHFGSPPPELQSKLEACAAIDAGIIAATRPGRTLDELYRELQRLYQEQGFPEEMQYHHQGGLTGYSSRERNALPGEKQQVAVHQIFAWNPTIAGVKSEDTIYVSEAGTELLTMPDTSLFPVIEVEAGGHTWRRPGILVR